MINRVIFLFAVLFFMLVSCGVDSKKQPALTQEELLHLGDSVANHAQKVLLENLMGAIKTSNYEGAVDFCNLNALNITQDISNFHHLKIQRLSNKNRNLQNGLKTNNDIEAWNELEKAMADKNAAKHFLKKEKNSYVYYKAIPLGMPTCLSCHGEKGTDIAVETEEVIAQKYPDDKATGYKLGMLRGMWKINMNKYD